MSTGHFFQISGQVRKMPVNALFCRHKIYEEAMKFWKYTLMYICILFPILYHILICQRRAETGAGWGGGRGEALYHPTSSDTTTRQTNKRLILENLSDQLNCSFGKTIGFFGKLWKTLKCFNYLQFWQLNNGSSAVLWILKDLKSWCQIQLFWPVEWAS